MKESVLVLVSGGVDSAVAAGILKEKGFGVQGLFLRMTGLPEEDRALDGARRICRRLGIRLHVRDIRDRFKSEIIGYFERSYLAGQTPNCCCICNWSMKVKTALQAMEQLGMDYFATGHYARIERCEGRSLLLAGRDPKKDQSYFLHRIDPGALARMILPLGGTFKERVRQMAHEMGLSDLIASDSQDICFFKGDYRAYFGETALLPSGPGSIIGTDGRVLGTHEGVFRYTVGQRRGLGIPDATPFYVVEIRASENVIVVGKEEELFRKRAVVEDVKWMVSPEDCLSSELLVKIRSRHRAAPAGLMPLSPDWTKVEVTFDEPQRAITPGQFAVFYLGRAVAGGGRICG